MKFALIALALLGSVSSPTPTDIPQLKAIETRYDQAKLATDETLREKYIMELALLRFHLSHGDSLAWQQVEAEMARHPAPANSDSAAFQKLRAGVWYSPRHHYLYRANGTWVMDPDGDPDDTHGSWSIKGNQYTEDSGQESETYTIILLTKDNFIFTPSVPEETPQLFFERRTKTGGLPIMRDDPAP